MKEQERMDLIDRDKALAVVICLGDDDTFTCIGHFKRILKALPSEQSEIIRCKDCKHHHYESKGIPYCDRIDYGYGWKDYDFCSRAERRTDERERT